MGAEFWEHQTAYQPDAEAALHQLQAEVFRDRGHDLAKLLQKRIDDMAEAIRFCEEDDPYNLLWTYRDGLRQLRQIAARGVPQDPAAGIAQLREIEAISSDQAPGILAVEGISTEWEEWQARLLSAEQIEEAFGTSIPAVGEVAEGIDRLTDSMGRGDGGLFLCLPERSAGILVLHRIHGGLTMAARPRVRVA